MAAAFDLAVRCLEKWRQRAVEEGPLALLERKPRLTPPTAPRLDQEGEAHLTKLACAVPPEAAFALGFKSRRSATNSSTA